MPRPSPRRLMLLAGVLLVIGMLGALAYLRWATILGWLDDERVNQAAVEDLRSATLPTPTAATPDIGWPQWRGPNRDGVAPAGPLNPDWTEGRPRRLWVTPCGHGYASLAVVGGRVYGHDFRDNAERIFCLDAETGKELWTFSEPADYSGMDRTYATGPRATPTVHGGKVYAVGAAGRFVCLEPPAASGGQPKLLWAHDLLTEFDAKSPQWGVACSSLIEGDLVVVQPGGRKGSVTAFDKNTGELRWSAGKDPSGYSSPVAATLGGVRQIVAVTGKSVLGIRPADGGVLWTYSWLTQFDANIATPLVVGDYVFVSSSYSKGCALLRVEGTSMTEVYFRKNRVMRNHQNTCVYRDGYLYGYDDRELKCVNLRTGEVVKDWEAPPSIGKGSVILVDKYLLGQTETGKLFLADADPAGFRLRGQTSEVFAGGQNWATPVLVDGRLYVRNHEDVKCFDVR